MKVWKRNLIAGAVLVTVCAGIYVNWLYTENQSTPELTETLNEEKLLDSDMLVMGDEMQISADPQDTAADYFAAVRLSRQQARDNAVGLLQEAMAYDDEAKEAQSNEALEGIVQTALNEAQIESLVIAKGYKDCVAYMNDEGVSVAVASPEGGLMQKDVAVIADIVMSQSAYTLENIRVVEVQ